MTRLPVFAEHDLLARGYSRRSLLRGAALLGGAATFYNEAALAMQFSAVRNMPAGAVRLNSNENPMGPCPEALTAILEVVKDGGRYRFDEAFRFVETLAETENVPASHVRAFAGSSDPLHRAVLAFASPTRPYVFGDPGYESGAAAAQHVGARVVAVPLTKNYAHDVRAMLKAAPEGGLYYICNPNNPTGTLTAREDIDWLVANKPAGAVVLVDEAYLHFARGATSCVDLAKQDKGVVVLRTFSKLYGMAGLRAGAAIGRPELLDKLTAFGPGILPTAGMAGATASLLVRDLVAQRRQTLVETRETTFEFLRKHGYSFLPSESNKFMLDVGKPGREAIRALATENVYIGRVWPAMPTYVRVTVGTREEMRRFEQALLKTVPAVG